MYELGGGRDVNGNIPHNHKGEGEESRDSDSIENMAQKWDGCSFQDHTVFGSLFRPPE